MTSVAFQSILREQIRKLPKILKFCENYSILFIRVLTFQAGLRNTRGPRSIQNRAVTVPRGIKVRDATRQVTI